VGTSRGRETTPNPPPVPPTLVEAIAALVNATADNTRFLREMAGQQMQQQGGRAYPQGPLETSYLDFSETRPPLFVKAIHLKTAGPLQSLPIPTWKWEDISLDFIVGLPRTTKGYVFIWVIIDRLTKIAHFLPVKVKYTVATYAELYSARILSLHGVPKTIVLDRGPQFVSKFWEELHKALDTKLLHSSTYHPQTSGQTERVNQILEDMLRACALEFPQKWDDCLPLVKFS
jgi:hypothetical protein